MGGAEGVSLVESDLIEVELTESQILQRSGLDVKHAVDLMEKLGKVTYKHHDESHIRVDNSICTNCPIDQLCTYVCPARVYVPSRRPGQVIHVSYENCVECGTCWVACTAGAIHWENPMGGHGVVYRGGE